MSTIHSYEPNIINTKSFNKISGLINKSKRFNREKKYNLLFIHSYHGNIITTNTLSKKGGKFSKSKRFNY